MAPPPRDDGDRGDGDGERGRMETNLCRSPAWAAAGAPRAAEPVSAKSFLGEFAVSERLGGLDLKVLAFVLERWEDTRPRDRPDMLHWPAEFTMYELCGALYNAAPSGGRYDHMRRSLTRLFRVEIDLEGYDMGTGRANAKVASKGRILAEIHWLMDDIVWSKQPDRVGGLRGNTFRAILSPWLARQVAAGYVTYLDFSILRRLNGVAERLWVYLQAESWSAPEEVNEATRWLALGKDTYAILGMRFARERAARAALVRAGDQIIEVDRSYKRIRVVQTKRGWRLVATRSVNARRRAERAAELEDAGILRELHGHQGDVRRALEERFGPLPTETLPGL